jgi:hypothetical protein
VSDYHPTISDSMARVSLDLAIRIASDDTVSKKDTAYWLRLYAATNSVVRSGDPEQALSILKK